MELSKRIVDRATDVLESKKISGRLRRDASTRSAMRWMSAILLIVDGTLLTPEWSKQDVQQRRGSEVACVDPFGFVECSSR